MSIDRAARLTVAEASIVSGVAVVSVFAVGVLGLSQLATARAGRRSAGAAVVSRV